MCPKVSQEHLQKRRTKIIKAAVQVFIKHGYERATMKHVMEEAEVSRGGLYQYFSNKEDLYETILKEALVKEVSENKELLEGSVDSYWELLLTSMHGKAMEPSDELDKFVPSNLEFFITGRNDERRIKYGRDRYYNVFEIYDSVIKAGQNSGEFSNKYNSEIIARSIVAFNDGIALHSILPKEDIKIKEQSIMFIEYLKMALGVDKPK
ncbi:TetR/AcrR family transcriptional regulator [Cytobacillus sp. IB215665]|uniref:TetR/AcrR family transcriptional regulator n=1 Tax=Cytobacillus sp. IB215665 TaxID=3097357 RepID=UPI002A106D60|nr:TetR family transcriptional regulator [Cytobacillus sp. IB215665]MDX8365265.1 TetR family transcriptional regulator [Cytobacillus sp. IB215665]